MRRIWRRGRKRIRRLRCRSSWRGDEPLAEFLAKSAPEIAGSLDALGKAGRLVLLLDGLNEVPTAMWKRKAAEVRKLGRDSVLVVSCRREDYIGDLDLGLDTLTLEPLTPQRIQAAVRHWVDTSGGAQETADSFFWQLAGDERLADVLDRWLTPGRGEDGFWSGMEPEKLWEKIGWDNFELWREHLTNPRSLMRLAANPFLLTMLFQVWAAEGGSLPANRGELFSRFINRLLSREELLVHDPGNDAWGLTQDGDRLLAGLAELAWRMQWDRIGAGRKDGDAP